MDNIIKFSKDNKFFVGIISILFIALTAANYKVAFNYDDPDQIIRNNTIHKFPDIITVVFDKQLRMMRVIQNITFSINWWMSNLNTWSYHITNNLIHMINTFLFYYIFTFIFHEKKKIIYYASIIFFLHPLQVQPVTYIMGRVDLLRTFFMLVAFIWYIKDQKPLKLYFLLVFSLLAKELNSLTPIIFISYDFLIKKIPFKKINWKIHLFYLSHVLWFIPISYIWKDTIAQHGDTFGFSMFHFGQYVLDQFGYLAFYLELFLNPNAMSIYHEYFMFTKNNYPYVIIGILVVLISLYLTYYFYIKQKFKHLFVLFFFYFSYLPTNSFLQFINPFAEYRLYLSLFFLILGFVWLIDAIKIDDRLKKIIYSFLIIYFSVFHFYQIRDWLNPLRVWKLADENYPESVGIKTNIGNILGMLFKKPEDSLPYFLEAKKFYDKQGQKNSYFDFLVNSNLAIAYGTRKEYEKAFDHLSYVMKNSFPHRTNLDYLVWYADITYNLKNVEEFDRAILQMNNFYTKSAEKNKFHKEIIDYWNGIQKKLHDQVKMQKKSNLNK